MEEDQLRVARGETCVAVLELALSAVWRVAELMGEVEEQAGLLEVA